MIWIILLFVMVFLFIMDLSIWQTECVYIMSIVFGLILILIFCVAFDCGLGDKKVFSMEKKKIEYRIDNYLKMEKRFNDNSKEISIENNSYFTELNRERIAIVNMINSYNDSLTSKKIYKEYWWWAIAINDFSDWEFLEINF